MEDLQRLTPAVPEQPHPWVDVEDVEAVVRYDAGRKAAARWLHERPACSRNGSINALPNVVMSILSSRPLPSQ